MSLLNMKLADVDTSRPCLQKGSYGVIIKNVELKEKSKEPGKYQLFFQFATLEPAHDSKGGMLNPGFSITKFFDTEPMENEKAEEIRQQQLATLVDILHNKAQSEWTKEDPRPDLTDEMLVQFKGLQLKINVGFDANATNKKTGEEYGPQNNINGYFPLN